MADKEQQEDSKWGKAKTDPATWWPKGCKSPNPSGRPKGAKSQKSLYKEAFHKQVTVNMDGQPEQLSIQQLGYHQLANKVAAGDLKAIAKQIELDEKFDAVEAAPPTPEDSAADFATFDAWLKLREKFKVFAAEQDISAPSGSPGSG